MHKRRPGRFRADRQRNCVFSGCVMRCVFCQNHDVSAGGFGKDVTVERLTEIFLELQQRGAYNINLVSPTPFVPQIIRALDIAKPRLTIPVVYNTAATSVWKRSGRWRDMSISTCRTSSTIPMSLPWSFRRLRIILKRR